MTDREYDIHEDELVDSLVGEPLEVEERIEAAIASVMRAMDSMYVEAAIHNDKSKRDIARGRIYLNKLKGLGDGTI